MTEHAQRETMTGTFKIWFPRNYGFIAGDDGFDYIAHVRQVVGLLPVKDSRVSFCIVRRKGSGKCDRAVGIEVIQ